MDLSLLGMKQIEKRGMMVAEEGEEVEEDHSEDAVVDLEEASEVEAEDLEEALEAVEEGLEDAVDLEAEVAEDSEEEEVEEAERAVLKQQNWKKQHHINISSPSTLASLLYLTNWFLPSTGTSILFLST